MSKQKKAAPRKRAGYAMPEPLPSGEVLEDNAKRRWKLGAPIGKGGFGEIYGASEEGDRKSQYVVKIEPHENGPLFVEMHFYMRNAKEDDVEEFRKAKKLSHLGMPIYISSGSHEHNGKKYRFLVMEKFGTDIWKLFLENNRKFPEATVYQISLQILDVLEYIHSKGYVHADIKGANILLSTVSKSHVYLVDFGLATHYSNATVYKPNPKKAHNGTIEYLSRDAHAGVETRRGDLEILAYNLIHWMGCTLPWESDLSDPKAVQKSKEDHMDDIDGFLAACFETPPSAIQKLLQYIVTLKFNEAPNYAKVRSILLRGLNDAGGALGKPLVFSNKKTPEKRKAVSHKSPKLKKKARAEERREDTEERTNSSTEENKNPTPKKSRKVVKKEEVKENGEDNYEGYTQAMLEIAKKKNEKKVKSKKLKSPVPSTSSGITDKKRTLRTQQPIVYYDAEDDPTPKKPIRRRK